jgi:hypothetical protein
MVMKKRGLGTFIFVCAVLFTSLFADERESLWTRSYRKVFSLQDQQHYDAQSQCTFERSQVMPFSQLIFSWNAVRPSHGFLVFFAQVRDKESQQWGPWHKMMSWGHMVQKSYEDKKQRGVVSSYHFVRLEVDKESLADAFRIRVEREDGARLSSLRSFVVSVTNLAYFVPEKMSDLRELSSVIIKGIPTVSQFMLDHSQADRLCSPTSCSMVVSFLGKKTVSPLLFADGVYDEGLGVYGSWPFNTAQIFEALQEKVSASVVRMDSFKQLHTQLIKGMPVVVSVRGSLCGAPKSYDNGHLLVVVGWDAQRREVVCNDPAHKTHAEVRSQYTLSDFLAAWERSRRLTYLIEPERIVEK